MHEDQPTLRQAGQRGAAHDPGAPISTTPEIEAAASMVDEPDHTDRPVPPPRAGSPTTGFAGPSGSFS